MFQGFSQSTPTGRPIYNLSPGMNTPKIGGQAGRQGGGLSLAQRGMRGGLPHPSYGGDDTMGGQGLGLSRSGGYSPYGGLSMGRMGSAAPAAPQSPQAPAAAPQSVGGSSLGLGGGGALAAPSSGQEAIQSSTPAASTPSPGLGPAPQPEPNPYQFDPFGTQASGGQYGNLSGTPAIFGASNYGGPGPGTLNTTPEAQAILARTKAAAMGNFNQGLNVMGQPTTAGQSGPQIGQTLGDNQWNGSAWVPKNYGAPQTGFFGGSNPGGY